MLTPTQTVDFPPSIRAGNDDVFTDDVVVVNYHEGYSERLVKTLAFMCKLSAHIRRLSARGSVSTLSPDYTAAAVRLQCARLQQACKKFIRTVGEDLPLPEGRGPRQVVVQGSVPLVLQPIQRALEIMDAAMAASVAAESTLPTDDVAGRRRLRRARFEYRSTGISALNIVVKVQKETRNALTKKASAVQ